MIFHKTVWAIVSDSYSTDATETTDPVELMQNICAAIGCDVPRLREQTDFIEDADTGEVLFRRAIP